MEDDETKTVIANPLIIRYGSFRVEMDEEGRPRALGQGTFGKTYLARHEYLDRMAALKVITERFAEERKARERFLREGRALVRLDHPHIARLYDFGEAGGELFYAMEYCSGGNLAELINRSGPLPVPQWLRIARQLSGALESCHAQNFIHRDIKPSNIMLAQPGEPLQTKLIDFGLVTADRMEGATETRSLGTPLYASPEQLREEKIDARSDLFSLGMTLWHLAAGQAPETGGSYRVMASRLSDESYAPMLPANLPEPVRELLQALVEKDRDVRLGSAAVLSQTLAQIEESLTPRPGSVSRATSLEVAFPGAATAENPSRESAAPAHGSSADSDVLPADASSLDTMRLPAVQPAAAKSATPPALPPRLPNPSTPAPAVAKNSLLPVLAIVTLLLLAAAAIGGFFLWKGQQPSRRASVVATTGTNEIPPTPAPVLEPTSTLEPPAPAVMPPGAVAMLAGMVPAKATFLLDQAPVTPVGGQGSFEIPVAGLKPPLELQVDAPGYRSWKHQIVDRAELKTPIPVRLDRKTGVVVFTKQSASEYSHASLKMEGALPGEEGVEILRAPQGIDLRGARSELTVPSGRFLVLLRSDNGRVVQTREFQRADVTEGQTLTLDLPPPVAGEYRGSLRDPQGAASATLKIAPGLRGGEYTDTRGGKSRRASLENGRLDSAGVFTARLMHSQSVDSPGYDEVLTATPTEAGLQITVTEAADEDAEIKKRVGREPLPEAQWSRAGVLERQ